MRRRDFFALLAGSSLFILFSNRSACSQEVGITNATYTIMDSNVVIHYDLNGPTGKQYKVELVPRRQTQLFSECYLWMFLAMWEQVNLQERAAKSGGISLRK
jgi:hypothetical protein